MLWTTSDAVRAIEDVQTLMSRPNEASVLHSLAKEETQLDDDRGTAIAQEQAADHTLQTHLQPVDLPAVTAADERGLSPGVLAFCPPRDPRVTTRVCRHPREGRLTPSPFRGRARGARCRGRPRSQPHDRVPEDDRARATAATNHRRPTRFCWSARAEPPGRW